MGLGRNSSYVKGRSHVDRWFCFDFGLFTGIKRGTFQDYNNRVDEPSYYTPALYPHFYKKYMFSLLELFLFIEEAVYFTGKRAIEHKRY